MYHGQAALTNHDIQLPAELLMSLCQAWEEWARSGLHYHHYNCEGQQESSMQRGKQTRYHSV